jgi:PAS domain S-box-containing protein
MATELVPCTQTTAFLPFSEDLFRATFEQAAVGMAHVAPDGRWLRVNQRLCAILGYTEAELLTKTFQELTHPDDLLADLAQVTQMLAGEIQTYTMHKRYWHKHGQLVWANLTVSLIRDRLGAPDYFVSVVEDITALKQTEKALRASEERLRLALVAARMATFEYDAVTQMVQRSPNARAIQGLGERGVGGEYAAYVHPDDRTTLCQIIEGLTPAQDSYEYEYRFIRPDTDATIWLLDRAQAFFDGQGHLQRITGVVLDITERKQAAEELRSQRDFLQLVIDQVPDLIMVKDQAGRFQLVNASTAQRFGLQVTSMVGKTDAEINPNPEEVSFFRQKDREALARDQALFIPEERMLGDYYQTSKIPLKNRTGTPDQLLIVAVDITARKRTEAALQQALLVEKEVSALKSNFVTTASHEFRTPLAIILAMTETLMAYRPQLSDEQIHQRLGQIKNQVMRLKGMMTDMLELAHMQASSISFTPLPVNPDTFCRTLLAELQNVWPFAQRLSYRCDGEMPAVKLDERLMRQILRHLVANAVKYSAVDKTVAITLTAMDDALVLTVRDEGLGIPIADQKHVFQPFYRATNVGTIAGTGLGLSMTQAAVAVHGGTITIESEVNIGTTVTVSLPLERQPSGSSKLAETGGQVFL